MVEALGVSYKDLDVFITHGHPDHMGLNVFNGQSKCLQAQPYDTIRYLTEPYLYVRLSRIWKQHHLCVDCHREFAITSPVTGGMIPPSEVKDETFASGMLGQGIAIKPVVGKVIAPFECPGQCSVRSPPKCMTGNTAFFRSYPHPGTPWTSPWMMSSGLHRLYSLTVEPGRMNMMRQGTWYPPRTRQVMSAGIPKLIIWKISWIWSI